MFLHFPLFIWFFLTKAANSFPQNVYVDDTSHDVSADTIDSKNDVFLDSVAQTPQNTQPENVESFGPNDGEQIFALSENDIVAKAPCVSIVSPSKNKKRQIVASESACKPRVAPEKQADPDTVIENPNQELCGNTKVAYCCDIDGHVEILQSGYCREYCVRYTTLAECTSMKPISTQFDSSGDLSCCDPTTVNKPSPRTENDVPWGVACDTEPIDPARIFRAKPPLGPVIRYDRIRDPMVPRPRRPKLKHPLGPPTEF